MSKFLGLDRISKFFAIVKENGGIKASLYRYFLTDDLKDGKLIGTDSFGNKYYENPRYFYGRNRWVIYNPRLRFDYDASQVTAEWYGWLHYKTDLPPNKDKNRPKYPWMAEHTENMSGTPEQWTPYSTTLPKIEPWDPKKARLSV